MFLQQHQFLSLTVRWFLYPLKLPVDDILIGKDLVKCGEYEHGGGAGGAAGAGVSARGTQGTALSRH